MEILHNNIFYINDDDNNNDNSNNINDDNNNDNSNCYNYNSKDYIIFAFTKIIATLSVKQNNSIECENKIVKQIFDLFVKNKIYDNNIYTIDLDQIAQNIYQQFLKQNMDHDTCQMLNVFDKKICNNTTTISCINHSNCVLIGSGSFSNVYKFRNTLDNKEYAIKKIGLNDKCVDISTESMIMAEMYHKNIVRYHSTWMDPSAFQIKKNLLKLTDNKNNDVNDNSSIYSDESEYNECNFNNFIFIQMELCKCNLKSYIDNLPYQLSYKQKLNICLQISKGVQYIHSKNIIHRDLKLQNILVSFDNVIKIADFGLATKLYNIDRNKIGTYSYIAPEILNGSQHTFQSDIYSLGIIFAEIYSNFKTQMEKFHFIDKMKNANKHIDITTEHYYFLMIIKSMLNTDHNKRMSINMIVKCLKMCIMHNQNQLLKILE